MNVLGALSEGAQTQYAICLDLDLYLIFCLSFSFCLTPCLVVAVRPCIEGIGLSKRVKETEKKGT